MPKILALASDPSNAALEWQAGIAERSKETVEPVHSRGMFEGVLIARQDLLCCVSKAVEIEVSIQVLETKTVFSTSVSASLDVNRSVGMKPHCL
jgi:hypothetical protein